MTATVRRVTPPQARGVIPPAQSSRLEKAREAKTEADEEFKAAVVAALKAGGSVREVSKLAEISDKTVQDWGHAGGWPTPAQKAARDEARERRAEERRLQQERYEQWLAEKKSGDAQ